MLRAAAGHVKRVARKNKPTAIKTWRIVRGDKVEMISGKWKGRQGVVLKALRKSDQIVVDGINEVTRLTKTSPDAMAVPKTYSAPVHYSNALLVDPSTGKPTRILMGSDAEGNNIRVAVKTGAIIPKPLEQGKRDTPKAAALLTWTHLAKLHWRRPMPLR